MDRLAIAANVFPHLHTHSTGVQRNKSFTEMTDGQSRAKEKVSRDRGQEHNSVHQHETQEVQPTKSLRIQPLFRNQWHAEFESALNHPENCKSQDHLKYRDRPDHDLHSSGEINPEWKRG